MHLEARTLFIRFFLHRKFSLFVSDCGFSCIYRKFKGGKIREIFKMEYLLQRKEIFVEKVYAINVIITEEEEQVVCKYYLLYFYWRTFISQLYNYRHRRSNDIFYYPLNEIFSVQCLWNFFIFVTTNCICFHHHVLRIYSERVLAMKQLFSLWIRRVTQFYSEITVSTCISINFPCGGIAVGNIRVQLLALVERPDQTFRFRFLFQDGVTCWKNGTKWIIAINWYYFIVNILVRRYSRYRNRWNKWNDRIYFMYIVIYIVLYHCVFYIIALLYHISNNTIIYIIFILLYFSLQWCNK